MPEIQKVLAITLTPGIRRHELIKKSIYKVKAIIGMGNKEMKTVDFRKNITTKLN
jgi:hypothetical protein